MAKTKALEKSPADDRNAVTKSLVLSPEGERLKRVLDATSVENPKRQDIDELRTLLTELPTLWKIAGDYADFAVNAILKAGTKQALVRKSAAHGLQVLKKELGYDQAPALERLLIENIVICRLQFYDTESRFAQNQGGTIAQADYWERRLSHTQNRYMKACETLARVRKLAQPGPVQVNIGARQVNIAQGKESTAGPADQIAPEPETKEVNRNE